VTLNPHKNPMMDMKPNKYQAIALWEKRIEDRRFGPPLSADDLIAQLRLKRARLAYIREKKSPIPFKPIVGNAKKMPDLWRNYLAEMGERPHDFHGALFGPIRGRCEQMFKKVGKRGR
jgi:hypothetical protein